MRIPQQQQKSVGWWSVVLFLVFTVCLELAASRSYNNGLIFYDLETTQPYLPPTVSVSRGRGLASVKFSEKGSIWSTFGKPCECRSHLCGCCAGIKVKQYNFDQKMCANVTFVPPKEEALLEVYLNERQSSKYGISVRNPSPFCIPVMMGVPMAMCVQMSDIAIKGNNLNMCMDFIVRLATTDLFEMHFQCMQMGLDGFEYIDKDGKPVIPPGNSKSEASEDDYYDYDADENANENENENEIGYGANEQAAKDNVAIVHNDQQFEPVGAESAFNVGLQQQLQQLQAAQQIEIAKDDLLTQIHESTTFAPIVVEAETEEIAAISTTANIEGETPLAAPTTTAVNSIDNDFGNDAPANNYNDAAVAVASASITTTEGAISKPIAAPINAYTDATTSENADNANSDVHVEADIEAEADAETIADVAPSVDGTLLENITTNYAADTLSATDAVADIETTALPVEDPTATNIGAPVIATTATATATAATIELAAINSTAYEATPTESTALTNEFQYASSNATITSSTTQPAATTPSVTTATATVTAATAATENAVHAVDNAAVASTTPLAPQAPNNYPSYRRFYG